uniref:C6 transcription factor n=1 Tax=Mesocestoides corti TaxID=53468 RepID=A0A5K3FY46_MESCO
MGLRRAEMNPSHRLPGPQASTSLPIFAHLKLSPPDFDAASPSTLSQPTTSEQCSESHSAEMQPQPSATSSQTPTNPQLLSMETSMQTMPTPQILHTTDELFDMLTDPDLAYSSESLPSTSQRDQKSQNAEMQWEQHGLNFSEMCMRKWEAETSPEEQSCSCADVGPDIVSLLGQCDGQRPLCIIWAKTVFICTIVISPPHSKYCANSCGWYLTYVHCIAKAYHLLDDGASRKYTTPKCNRPSIIVDLLATFISTTVTGPSHISESSSSSLSSKRPVKTKAECGRYQSAWPIYTKDLHMIHDLHFFKEILVNFELLPLPLHLTTKSTNTSSKCIGISISSPPTTNPYAFDDSSHFDGHIPVSTLIP